MLALAEDPVAAHGPLELLMTFAEEVGMAGAADLSPELIGGSVLLNLDSGEDATLTVGCAGGVDTLLRADAARAPLAPGDVALRVTVGGGLGGHSGGDIAAGRANAIKLLAQVLSAVPELRLATLSAGPLRMRADFPGVVEASSSLGIAETDGARLTLRCLSRSADDDVLPEVTGAIAAAGRLAGAAVEPGQAYPGWRPDLGSTRAGVG